MFKAWANMWKNTFNFKGTVDIKNYWFALILNVPFMYIAVVPYALITKHITDNLTLILTVFFVVTNFPALSMYFRRARDAGWNIWTAIYLALIIPIFSGILAGTIKKCGKISKGYSLVLKMMALGLGLFFYGGTLGFILYDDPTSIPALPMAGLLLISAILIVYGIVNWRTVLAVWFGTKDE